MEVNELADKLAVKISCGRLNDCWYWIGAITDGYGTVHVDERVMRVHRLVYSLLTTGKQDLAANIVVRHKCHDRQCVNPMHLQAGSHFDNFKDNDTNPGPHYAQRRLNKEFQDGHQHALDHRSGNCRDCGPAGNLQPPMIENPFKTVRLEHNWTQEQTAEIAGITRQVVTLTEQGLYLEPPRNLVVALSSDSEERRAFLRLNYPTWVSERRRLNASYFSSVDLALAHNRFSALMHQVARKMQAKPGIASLSRAMVYQRSLLSEFQKYGRGRQSIFDALIECGLDPEQAVMLIGSK